MLAVIFWLLIAVPLLSAQQTDNPDVLFKMAREAAFEEGNYEKARKLAYKALEGSPNYHGIRVFVARTLTWERNYSKAREELDYVLKHDSTHYEALKARIDLEKWSDNPQTALKFANQALSHYPRDTYFLNEKGGILYTLGQIDEAKDQYQTMLSIEPTNQKAKYALQSIKEDSFKYSATVSYRQDRFREIFDPWNFAIFKLSRATPYGSITSEIQYANRFGTNGVQYSLRGYPSIASGLYAYVNAGFSKASIFPDYRFDMSLYKSLPAGFAADAGFRYLNFGSGGTWIYTGAISKYYGRFYFTGRTYITPGDTGTSSSFSLSVRKNFGSGSQRYFEVSAGAGSGPSDPQFQQDIQQLNSWGVSAGLQLPLNYRTLLGASAGYDSEDFLNFTRQRFSFKVSLSYEF